MKLFPAVLFAASLASVVARADDKADCLATYRQAQIARKQGDILSSRESLVTCSRAVCPAIVKQDCVAWLAEVAQSVGSILVTAVDGGGKPVTLARVLIDGKQVATSLDGRPIEVSPGTHVTRVEVEGAAPVEQTIVVGRGERNHPARFVVAAGAAGQESKAAETSRPIPLAAIILGGVGVASLIAGGVAGIVGLVDYGQKAGTCKPNCVPASVDPIRVDYTIFYVGLGVGSAALITAAVLFLTRPTAAARTAFEIAPTAQGATLLFRHTF